MTAEYNFVQVMYALFEPELKLRISAAIPYEADSNFEIRVDHDPEIDVDKLEMPAPARLLRRWSETALQPPPKFVPLRSDKSRMVTKLWGHIERQPDHVRLVVKNLGSGFSDYARKLEEALGDKLAGDGFELIHHIVKVGINFPLWDQQAKLVIGDIEGRALTPHSSGTIELYLERSLAEQLAANSSFSFDVSIGGDVLVARRETRQ